MTQAKPHGYWKANLALLAQQAATLSDAAIAKLHGTTEKAIRCTRHKHGIASHGQAASQAARTQHLQLLAQTHTAVQIAAIEGKTTSAIYQELTRRGIAAQCGRSQPWPPERQQALSELARTHNPLQLAAHYQVGAKYMYRLLREFGIQAQPTRPPQPKAAKPARMPRTHPKAAPRHGTVPPRTSIASKTPAQIIWPEHVKVQHIALPQLPSNAPICASTMRSPLHAQHNRSGYCAL